MVAGITASQNFLLFLTADVFQSKWVQLEVKEALRLKKNFVLLLEEDERHARFRFGEDMWSNYVEHHLPMKDARAIIATHEAITYRRKSHERFAMLQRLLYNAKVAMPIELKLMALKTRGQMYEEGSHGTGRGMHRIEQKLNAIRNTKQIHHAKDVCTRQ